jgi:hypothetical protein
MPPTLETCEPTGLPQKMSIRRAANFFPSFPDAAFPGWIPLVMLPCLATALRAVLQPWVLMWTLAMSLYIGLKWLTWWRVRRLVPHTHWRSLAYLLAWPGMDAQAFLDEMRRSRIPGSGDWFWAICKTVTGAILLWTIERTLPPGQPVLRGWTGMLGLLLLLHFGSFHLLALLWQSLGVDAQPIMAAPFRSRSLSEFWGKRWNLGFRQLAHQLIFLPLRKYLPVEFASLVVFFASGLVHDWVISVPAQSGYGLPTGYFLLQGFGVLLERSPFGRWVGLGKGLSGWVFMVLVLAGPLFWLFHPAFVLRVILPFLEAIHAL